MRQTALKMVYELAQENDRVVFIGSDLGPKVLLDMKEEMPERFFMEGVSEQALVSMAAGMAMEGFKPYVNTIATFLTRRCFEQVAVDLCLHNLPVTLLSNGGGLVYAPLGPTHLALEDIAILRPLPNMTICAPSDAEEMRRLMKASLDWKGPMYIRFAKGGDPIVSSEDDDFQIGKAILRKPAGNVLAITTGITTNRALQACDMLGEGINMGVLHMHTIKPLDVDAVLNAAKDVDLIVTIEEHMRTGGLGSAILEEVICDHQIKTPMLRLGLEDDFPHGYGSQDHLLEAAHLQPPQLAQKITEAFSKL